MLRAACTPAVSQITFFIIFEFLLELVPHSVDFAHKRGLSFGESHIFADSLSLGSLLDLRLDGLGGHIGYDVAGELAVRVELVVKGSQVVVRGVQGLSYQLDTKLLLRSSWLLLLRHLIYYN